MSSEKKPQRKKKFKITPPDHLCDPENLMSQDFLAEMISQILDDVIKHQKKADKSKSSKKKSVYKPKARHMSPPQEQADPMKMTDGEFALFLSEEENEREKDPLYRRSDSIFITFIEQYDEDASALKRHGIDAEGKTGKVSVYDVYVGVDCHYRSVGCFLSLRDAQAWADKTRLKLERQLKNTIKHHFGMGDPWSPPPTPT
jgi:hypothetical protein